MNVRISVFVVLIALSSAAARGEESLPGEQPQFFVVTAINKDHLVVQRRPPSTKEVDVPLIVYKPALKTLKATDGKGKKLTAEEVVRRVKTGSVVLVSADENPVDAAYLAVIKEDTVILIDVFPRKGATGAQVE